VIERDRARQLVAREDRGAGCVVAALGRALGAADEHGRNGVVARIARRIGVNAEELEQLDVEPRFLARFATRRIGHELTAVDVTAGQSPTGRRMAAFDEYDAARHLDDHVDGRARPRPGPVHVAENTMWITVFSIADTADGGLPRRPARGRRRNRPA